MNVRGLVLGVLMIVAGAELMMLGACDGRRQPSPAQTSTTMHPHASPTGKARVGHSPKPALTTNHAVLTTPRPPITTIPLPSGYLCKDGTHSHAAHRQGACSHHGGVA
jgi:hypothetical protein